MSEPKPTDTRRHRALTDRNLLIGFFVVLLVAGGILIYQFYGALAALEGVLCIVAMGVLAGVVMLVMSGLGRLSTWLDDRD